MKTNKRSPIAILKDNFYMLSLIAKHTPLYLVCSVILAIAVGIIDGFLNSVCMRRLFNALQDGDFHTAVVSIVMIGIGVLVFVVYSNWYSTIYQPKIREVFRKKLHTELYKKALDMELKCYDDPEFYNDYVWAISESDKRAVKVLLSFEAILRYVISTGIFVGVIIDIDIWCLIVIIACNVPLTFILNTLQKINLKRREEQMPIERRSDYYKRVQHLPEYSKEIRLSNVCNILDDKYYGSLNERKRVINKFIPKALPLDILHTIISNFGRYIVYGIIIYRIYVTGTVQIGDAVAILNSVFRVYYYFDTVRQKILQLAEHSLYTQKFRKFMEYSPQKSNSDLPVYSLGDVKLENVSFSYRDGNDYALKNVTMHIKKGEKIAIVGYNGAGKSTLVKLIMGLYSPQIGTVSSNGINISDYDAKQYRRKISAVFQDHVIFASNIAQNVLADVYDQKDEQKVLDALDKSTFTSRLATMEKGIYTQLTREFDDDGINLSGGEAQKIAIARAFAADSDIIIMDEPSSALDPIAEYELNNTVMNNTKSKTVIFISHRLSTTKMADRIYMFDSGELIEQGSHDELMAQNGKYAQMFHIQAEKYARKS